MPHFRGNGAGQESPREVSCNFANPTVFWFGMRPSSPPVTPGKSCVLLAFIGIIFLTNQVMAVVPPLLDQALRRASIDQGHWAWTWTSVYHHSPTQSDGKSVMRNDPSKPEPEQTVPILIAGLPPTAKQFEDYKRLGAEKAKRLADPPLGASLPGDYEVHMGLGMYLAAGQQAVAYYDQATLASEDAASATFEVPLHSNKLGFIPIDLWGHFHMRIRIAKRGPNFEHASITVLKPIKFVKMKEADIEVNYSVIDPAYPAVITRFDAAIVGGILGHKEYLRQEAVDSDFVRVKPYSDRFEVKIGLLRTIGF
jgi:hypothetical protein